MGKKASHTLIREPLLIHSPAKLNETFHLHKYCKKIKLQVAFFTSGYIHTLPPLITPTVTYVWVHILCPFVAHPVTVTRLHPVTVGGCMGALPQAFQKHRGTKSTGLITSYLSAPARQNRCRAECPDHHGPLHSYIIYQHISCFQLIAVLTFFIYHLTVWGTQHDKNFPKQFFRKWKYLLPTRIKMAKCIGFFVK